MKKKEINKLIQYYKELEVKIPDSEINAEWNKLNNRLNSEKKVIASRRRRYLYQYISIAAAVISVALIVGVNSFYSEDNIMQYVANVEAGQPENNKSSEIQLIMNGHDVIHIKDTALVSYSSQGNVKLTSSKTGTERTISDVVKKEDKFDRIVVPKGKYARLALADGSQMHINAGTTVVYPKKFTGNKRIIYVDGEIFINVTPDKEKPFIVKTHNFDIRVLGTSFNVNAYKSEDIAEVVLVEGAVKIKNKEEKNFKLSPNEYISFSGNNLLTKKHVNAKDYTDWTKGYLSLSDKNIQVIFNSLSKFYGEDITYDPAITNLSLKGKIDLNVPLEKVLGRVSKIIPIDVQVTDKGYYISLK